jgi:hypothetical protein
MQVLAFSHDENMLVLAHFFIYITIYKQQNVKKIISIILSQY